MKQNEEREVWVKVAPGPWHRKTHDEKKTTEKGDYNLVKKVEVMRCDEVISATAISSHMFTRPEGFGRICKKCDYKIICDW